MELLLVILSLFYLIGLPIIVLRHSSRIRSLEEKLLEAQKDTRETARQTMPAGLPSKVTPPIAASVPQRAERIEQPRATKVTSTPVKKSLEEQVGGNVFQWVGIGALVLALLFFLKWSFDNGFIGPTGRTLIGYLLSGAAIVAGDRLRKRYGVWALAFTGGGALGGYIVTMIGLHSYHLFPAGVAFSIDVLITVVTCLLAGFYGSVPLAAFGIVGGFLTPVLVGGESSTMALLLYILILDLGVLMLTSMRSWRRLTSIALVGTFFYEFASYGSFLSQSSGYDLSLSLALIFTVAFLVLFGFIPFFHNYLRKQAAESTDIFLLVGNALGHFAFVLVWLSTVEGLLETYDALTAFCFAVAFLLFSSGVYRANKKDSPLVLASLSLTILFAALMIPLQFGGLWVPLAWSLEGAFLLWLALYLHDSRIQRFAWVLMGASYFWYFFVPIDTTVVWQPGVAASALLLPSGIFLFFPWLLLALGVLWVGLQRPDRREQHLLPFAVVIGAVLSLILLIHLFGDTASDLTWTQRFIEAVVLIGAGYLALFAARLYRQSLDESEKVLFSGLGIVLQILTLLYLTRECVRAVDEGFLFASFQNPSQALQVGISILWALYGAATIVVGIVRNWKQLRVFSIVLLLIATVKLAVWDFFSLGTGARVIGFTVLGGLLVAASFLYQRKKEALKSFFVSSPSQQ